jgi:class 3 adenylate cyclase
MQKFNLGFDKRTGSVPEEYDEYYLQIVKASLRYACPIGALVYIAFFPLDLIVTGSSSIAIKTLALRSSVSLVALALWRFAPLISSVRLLMFCTATLYLFAMLIMVELMYLMPLSLTLGQPSLLILTMCACGMFFLRPMPLAIVGSLGLIANIYACLSAGLSPQITAINAIQFGTGILISCVFMVLLEKELRKKHSLERSLQAGKEQSDVLLHDILPAYVIERIEEGAEYIADAVPEVDIIFIDIVGSSAMATYLGPTHLIEILGKSFRSFDENCERHGVTKIKTIGDSYMAATNLPEASEFSAIRAIEFCQEALVFMKDIAKATGIPIDVRIGVATGSVIAGLLSLKRPAYDLWGETVNLASRMESTGEPGRIQIAEKTYWRIKDRFGCEARSVDVEGLGRIKTYFITQVQAVTSVSVG